MNRSSKSNLDHRKSQLQQSKVEKYNNYLESSKMTDIKSVVYDNSCKYFTVIVDIDKFSKHNSSNTSLHRPSSSSKYSNINSLGTKQEITPRALICISNNVNNIKMIPAPVFAPKEQRLSDRHERKFEGTWLSSDSSSAATIGKNLCLYNFILAYEGKHTISSESSDKQVKYQDFESTNKYACSKNPDKIDEVDEGYSEQDSREKTIEASAVAKYEKKLPDSKYQGLSWAHQVLLHDENMITQKNSNGYYNENVFQNHYNNDNRSSLSKNSTGSKRNKKHWKKASIDENIPKSQSSRNMSRHKRINASENYNSTVIRNMSAPDLIEEYEVTERIPAEAANGASTSKYAEKQYKFYDNGEKAEHTKYADKYSLTKKCKYYRELQLSKLNEQNNELLEQSKGLINNNEYEELKAKIGHRRVVSANNYNSNKVISKRLTSANEFYDDENTNERESKSTEKHIVYHNYMSNQNSESNYEYQKKKYRKI